MTDELDALDALAPHFLRAQERWPEAPTLSKHYDAMAESFGGSAHSLIATVKSFIECVCLTILGEYGKAMPSSDPSTTELLVEALKPLGLQNSRGASKIDKLLSAHNRMADALSDMRNENDPVAHGKDGFIDTLTRNERRAYLITADTILALLLSAHDGTEPDIRHTREPYARFTHLHERIDRAVSLESVVEHDEQERPLLVVRLRTGGLSDEIELRVEPSRLLYAIDRTAYVELLASAALEEGAILSVEEGAAEVTAAGPIHTTESTPPNAEIVPSYQGPLSPLKPALAQYLQSLDLKGGNAPVEANLSDSILATAEPHMGLDWTERDPLQAAMKVAIKRALIQFGMSREHAEEGADHLISWFKIQAVGLGSPETTAS